MGKLIIEGGTPLAGTVTIHGAKNAALPILAASLLVEGKHQIQNVPNLLDIEVMIEILEALGCDAIYENGIVQVDTTLASNSHVPEHLMGQMRSSIFLMGPLLARFGEVSVYQPGGCAIGERKVDLHLRGLQALGAEIYESNEMITCKAKRLIGTEITLDYPSVGATENIMMAAVTAEGTTTITNAAREPEIQDLQNYLNKMGARIMGAGTDEIRIEGVTTLIPRDYHVIPDRIVAGTLMIAAAVTKGNVTLENVNPQHLHSLIHVLRRSGIQITTGDDMINVKSSGRAKALDRIITAPYPSFPTDLQSQIMVFLCLAEGISIVKETVFEGRFKHVDELCRMGADIQVDLNSAFIRGVPRLYGATVEASDLRAGAALVIAGLAAKGTTIVEQIQHIDRGYDQIEQIFKQLGASIRRYKTTSEARNISAV